MTPALDDELAAAAPPISPRTPALGSAVREMIADTERQSASATVSRLPRRRRAAVLVLTASTLLGTATTVAAAGWLPTPWWEDDAAVVQPTTSASGEACTVTYAARPFTDAAHPVSEADRAAALAAAEEFLRDVDATTLAATGSDTIFLALNRRLTAELRRQGLSAHAVGVALATDCPDEGPQ